LHGFHGIHWSFIMRKKTTFILAATVATALSFGAATSLAQTSGYTGPSSAQTSSTQASGYTGPSGVQLLNVQQVHANGQDDQHVRLQGRIISHDGGDHYTFEDATGRMTVDIDDDDFPRGQPISAEQKVELLGEIDRKRGGKLEVDVDRITLL
jgi:uncharacterized protein (TIGR00156 family)